MPLASGGRCLWGAVWGVCRRAGRFPVAYPLTMSETVRLTATVSRDDEGWFVARCVQVEVTSQGRTVEAALANLVEALELYYQDEPVPEIVEQPIVAPIEIRLSA